jgi:hypothetical protein
LLRAEIETGRVSQEKGHDILIEPLVRADRAGEIPTVDRGVEDSHRQQFAPGPITSRVMSDAFERAVLAKARDNDVRRPDKRRQRVVTKMIDGACCFDLFSCRAGQQQPVANIAADDVIDERANNPLGARRRSPPVVGPDEAQPPCELLVGHQQQLDRLCPCGHIRIVAPCHAADQVPPGLRRSRA